MKPVLAVLAICAASGAFAQNIAFEAAAAKSNLSQSPISNYPRMVNGRANIENATLRRLISVAYEVSETRIDGPEWLDKDRFDITAKAPDGAPDSQFPAMLQALLEDRFKLAVHRQSREAAVYVLVVAKDGLKMKLFDPAHPPQAPRSRGQAVIVGAGTMPGLATMLERPAGRPIIDKTGIEGRYAYALSFTAFSSEPTDPALSDSAPDLFAAVQQQLGLKLDSSKESMSFLIVYRANRNPSSN